MQTLYLFGSDYAAPDDLHRALRRLLHLPPHYGMNADALYDCLTDLSEPAHLTVLNAQLLPALERVVRDAAGENPLLETWVSQ